MQCQAYSLNCKSFLEVTFFMATTTERERSGEVLRSERIAGTNPANLANLMYYILFASITVIWCFSMIFQFIDVIVIRYKYREAFVGTRLAPDWVFYLASLLGLLASGVGLYATVTAPWVPTLIETARWDTWIAAIVVLSLIAAATIYVIGHARIRDDVTDKQAIAAARGTAEKA